MSSVAAVPAPQILQSNRHRSRQMWTLPTHRGFLKEFLSYVFVHYWDQIIFGPVIQGAAYEFACPHAPSQIEESNGDLTIHFGASHFHLCIDGPGESNGVAARPDPHRPAHAAIFRQLDREGCPISWGFEMSNGLEHPMLSIFFASPFIRPGDQLLTTPEWERLTMWRDIAKRYLGREPEEFDESGTGFINGNY